MQRPGIGDGYRANRNDVWVNSTANCGDALGNHNVVGVTAAIVRERAVAVRPIRSDRPIGGRVIPRTGGVGRTCGSLGANQAEEDARRCRQSAAKTKRSGLSTLTERAKDSHAIPRSGSRFSDEP